MTLLDLRAALGAVRIESPSSFTLLGRRNELPPGTRLEQGLADAIYQALHCRVHPHVSVEGGYANWMGARNFADVLSSANSGTGCWQRGWIACAVEPDGRVVAERHGVRFWVPPDEYRPESGPIAVGETGAVRIPREYFELASGFYLAHGDADDTRGSAGGIRIYWHVAPAGAAWLMSLVTLALNRAGLGFQLKVLSEPLRYQRTDPAVLYLPRADYPRALPLLREVLAGVAPWLRSRVSLLVKPLAPGVGLAEDPGDGSSFGEHRARLLATILVDPEWSALPSEAARIDFCAARLARDGYDLDRLYLNPGSGDDFAPLGGAPG